MINTFAEKFTEKPISNIIKIRNQYFQLSSELEKEMASINKSLNKTAYSAGTFLGEEKGKRFFPSIALIDILAESCENHITVDEKAEWLFLCGRDILSNSVVDSVVGKRLKQRNSELAIVFNKRKEVLGYGLLSRRNSRNRPFYLKNVSLKNLLDRGTFLRKEMHKSN